MHRRAADLAAFATAALTAVGLGAVGLVAAAPALADPTGQLRAAVAATRATSCDPLRSDPVVEQAAAEINRTIGLWLDKSSRAEPESDAMPLLKDLGYPGTKSKILWGAGKNEADAIKGAILQGFAAIPDCGYTDFGASVTQGNNAAGWVLAAVVLGG